MRRMLRPRLRGGSHAARWAVPVAVVLLALSSQPLSAGAMPIPPIAQLALAALAGLLFLIVTAALGTLGLTAVMPRRGAPAIASPAADPRQRARIRWRVPADTTAWLHVVSGPDPEALAAAVLALAGTFRAAGRHVVMVDAGSRLALHDRLGRDARWGLGECLRDRMPALGVLQDTGCAGALLLARGCPVGPSHWAHLDRVLDELARHFDRCILAFDPGPPPAVAEALRGRTSEGWWAGEGRSRQSALVFAEHTGISLCFFEFQSSPQALLEALRAQWGRIDPAPGIAPSRSRTEAPVALPVVHSEVRVRERLRFLLWARRVGCEAEVAASPIAPPPRSAIALAHEPEAAEPEPAHTF
jgi:hypothetical protein